MSRYCIIKEEKSVLHEAVESGYSEIVQYLLFNKSFDDKIEFRKTTIFNDYFSTANKFYEENYQKTLLHFAIEKGLIGKIKLLISNQNIDINMKSKTEINEGGGCISCFEFTKTNEKSSLFYAIENGNINIIRALLEKQKIDVY